MDMDQLGATVSASFHIGAKGRVVLPAAVRRAARLDEGTEVVARTEGDGRVIIETVASVRARIWAAAPPDAGLDSAGLDSSADVRLMRDEDGHASDAASARRSREFRSEPDSENAGAALLSHLGL